MIVVLIASRNSYSAVTRNLLRDSLYVRRDDLSYKLNWEKEFRQLLAQSEQ